MNHMVIFPRLLAMPVDRGMLKSFEICFFTRYAAQNCTCMQLHNSIHSCKLGTEQSYYKLRPQSKDSIRFYCS